MRARIADAIKRLRDLIPELAKFGVVGSVGAIVDIGGADLLHVTFNFGPLKAKAISIAAATVVTYLGSRFWTFRHRANQPLIRGLTLFIVLNAVGLLIAEAVIALTTYTFNERGAVAYTIANALGTALGTVFRYFSYKRWVFLHPGDKPPANVPAGR